MNPFMWVYTVVSLLYLFGFMLSPLLLTVSVPMLPVAFRTPLGLETVTWWLD